MGWQMLPMIVLLSSLVGAIVGISLILLRNHQRDIPIPFGPYLAAAGWIAFLWGESLNSAYLNTFGLS
jgi:leader peptidase (prepilin peptidase)/N-methyltransferase